jgi:hypothetical protein
MAKARSVRVPGAANNTLTRKQIDEVGEASYDVVCAFQSIGALAEEMRQSFAPCENEAGVDLPAAILALCAFGQKANNAMFVIVCDPVEAARLEASRELVKGEAHG